ncbi:MAG: hypothetical protein ACRD50_14675 [Candidatus Acidiferrales bacterium]
MKKMPYAVSLLMLALLATAGAASPQPRPVKLVLSPRSTIPSGELLRHFSSHCSNVSLTMNSKQSDYMLEAGGWSGEYRFTLYAHGGDAIFSTHTARLGNAVKDTCKYLNSAH